MADSPSTVLQIRRLPALRRSYRYFARAGSRSIRKSARCSMAYKVQHPCRPAGRRTHTYHVLIVQNLSRCVDINTYNLQLTDVSPSVLP